MQRFFRGSYWIALSLFIVLITAAGTCPASSSDPPYIAVDSSWAVSHIWAGEVFYGKYLEYKIDCPRCIELAVANGLLKGFYYIDHHYGDELGRKHWDEEFLALGIKIADGVEILWDSDTRITLFVPNGKDSITVTSEGWVITKNRQSEVYSSEEIVAPLRLSNDLGYDATKKSRSIVVFTWFGEKLKGLNVDDIVRCEIENVKSVGLGKLAFSSSDGKEE